MPALYRIVDDFDPLRLFIQVSPTTDENLREHLEQQSAALERDAFSERRTVTVVDASLSTRPTPAQRKLQADWINAHAELLGRTSLGVAFVVPSPLVRGALTAIFWVASMPVRHTVHATLDSALAWAIEQLDAAGLEVPKLLREHGAAALALEVADARV